MKNGWIYESTLERYNNCSLFNLGTDKIDNNIEYVKNTLELPTLLKENDVQNIYEMYKSIFQLVGSINLLENLIRDGLYLIVNENTESYYIGILVPLKYEFNFVDYIRTFSYFEQAFVNGKRFILLSEENIVQEKVVERYFQYNLKDEYYLNLYNNYEDLLFILGNRRYRGMLKIYFDIDDSEGGAVYRRVQKNISQVINDDRFIGNVVRAKPNAKYPNSLVLWTFIDIVKMDIAEYYIKNKDIFKLSKIKAYNQAFSFDDYSKEMQRAIGARIFDLYTDEIEYTVDIGYGCLFEQDYYEVFFDDEYPEIKSEV